MLFFIGFITCWFLLGVGVILGDYCDWFRFDWFLSILSFPVLVVVLPLYILYALVYYPWQCVWRGVDKKRFDDVLKDNPEMKAYKLAPRLFMCWDREASTVFKRLFFVRVKKEEAEP